LARRTHGPPVPFDQVPHDGEPDAEPPVRAVECALALYEQVENVWQQLGRDSAAVVAHIDRDLFAFQLYAHLDLAAGIGVLHRVVQNVADALHEARAVPAHVDRREGLRDGEAMRFFAYERLHGLRRLLDDLAELERLAAQQDLPPRDARNVEQIVDEPRELARLTAEHRKRRVDGRRVARDARENL